MIEFLGSLHPVAVHFPIALVVTATIAEIFHARSRSTGPSSAARVMLAVAAPSGIISMVLGFAALGGRPFGPEIATAVGVHRVAGIVAAVMTALAAGLVESAARRAERWRIAFYRVVLALTTIAVMVAGHFGAVLSHGPDYPLFR